jgi:hypothetical protein
MNVFFPKLQREANFVDKKQDLPDLRPDIQLFKMSGIRQDIKSGIQRDIGSCKRPDIRCILQHFIARNCFNKTSE